MKPEVSLPCSQENTTYRCPNSHESRPRPSILLLWILFNCIVPSMLRSSSSLFHLPFFTTFLYAFYFLQIDAKLLFLPLPSPVLLFFAKSVGIVIKLRTGRPQKNFLFSRTSKPPIRSIYFLVIGRRTLYSRE